MAVRVAIEDAALGLREGARVVVRRAVGEEDDVAGGDRLAVEVDVVRRVPTEDLHRRHEPQELVDRRVLERIDVAEQLSAQLRVLREVQQAHAHRARGRLVAGEQHHHPELPHLGIGQAVAVDLRLDQRPEEVVARLPLALRIRPSMYASASCAAAA